MTSIQNTLVPQICNSSTALFLETKRDKKLQRHKADYQKNRNERLAYQKEYQQSNKDRITAYQKEYYQKNKEQYASRVRNRKSRKRNAIGKHTAADISTLLNLQKKKCAICHTSIAGGYHVDHIIALANRGGNDKYNLQLLCANCNREKKAKDPIDYMQQRGMLI